MALFKNFRERREGRLAEARQIADDAFNAAIKAGKEPDDAADDAVAAVKAKLSFMDILALLPQIMEFIALLRDLFRKSS